MNYVIIDKDGKRREAGRGEILQDGKRIVVAVSMMDQAPPALHDGMGHASGNKPGYVFSGGASLGASDAKFLEARGEYFMRLTSAWRSPASNSGGPTLIADQDARAAYETRLVNAWRTA